MRTEQIYSVETLEDKIEIHFLQGVVFDRRHRCHSPAEAI